MIDGASDCEFNGPAHPERKWRFAYVSVRPLKSATVAPIVYDAAVEKMEKQLNLCIHELLDFEKA